MPRRASSSYLPVHSEDHKDLGPANGLALARPELDLLLGLLVHVVLGLGQHVGQVLVPLHPGVPQGLLHLEFKTKGSICRQPDLPKDLSKPRTLSTSDATIIFWAAFKQFVQFIYPILRLIR